jgi:hypothetical protein
MVLPAGMVVSDGVILCHQNSEFFFAILVHQMNRSVYPMSDTPHLADPSVFRIGMAAQIVNGAHPGRRARRSGFVPPNSETFRCFGSSDEPIGSSDE